VIIDTPCVSQFYLLKLVTGNQRAMRMKFAVRINGRMILIEFSIKIIVGKTKDRNRNAERQLNISVC